LLFWDWVSAYFFLHFSHQEPIIKVEVSGLEAVSSVQAAGQEAVISEEGSAAEGVISAAAAHQGAGNETQD
jgi:hypothetical protein